MSESHAPDINTITLSGLRWAKYAILDKYNRIVRLVDTRWQAEEACASPSSNKWIPVQITELEPPPQKARKKPIMRDL